MTSAHLPAAVARLHTGERLAFGDIVVDRHTVSVRDKTRPWAGLVIRLANGQVYFEEGPGRHALPAVVNCAVPNLYLFLTLAKQLCG